MRDGELNFCQIRHAKAEGAKALRQGFCRAEMAEMRPPARARFIQRFLKGKWKTIILWRLRLGHTSLAKLGKDIEGITQKMLLEQLKEFMVENNMTDVLREKGVIP